MDSHQTITGAVLLALSVFAGLAPAQQVSGSITGVVQDPQAQVVPNARVMLINQAQGVTAMQAVTSQEGTFVFTPLLPAQYTVTVEAAGFKRYSRTDISLDANQRLGIPPIALEVGSPTEAITVEANAVALETVSATRSGVVGQSQVNDLAMNGRNLGAVMRIVPGVQNDTSTANGQAIGGQRTDQYTYTLDGVTMEDSGCGCFAFRYSVDSIAEITVATNGLAAEYGHSAGPQITVVSKSGTRAFHGTGYWFHRDESFNANTYTNNLSNIARPIYRYLTAGWNLGGPFYIPHLLNKNRDKVFFFVQHRQQHGLFAMVRFAICQRESHD
jgi:Carboxypeptidase regulatory-like domain